MMDTISKIFILVFLTTLVVFITTIIKPNEEFISGVRKNTGLCTINNVKLGNNYGYTYSENIPEFNYNRCIGLTETEYRKYLKPDINKNEKPLPFYVYNNKFRSIDIIIREMVNQINKLKQNNEYIGTCVLFVSKEDDGLINTFICFPDMNKDGIINKNKIDLAISHRNINSLLINPYFLSNYCYNNLEKSKNNVEKLNREGSNDSKLKESYCSLDNKRVTNVCYNSRIGIVYSSLNYIYRMNCGCSGERCRCNKSDSDCKKFAPGCKTNYADYDLCKEDKKWADYQEEAGDNDTEVVPRQSRHFAIYTPDNSEVFINYINPYVTFTNRSYMIIGQVVGYGDTTHLISENGLYKLKTDKEGLLISRGEYKKYIYRGKLSEYGNLQIMDKSLVVSDRKKINSEIGGKNIKVLWKRNIDYTADKNLEIPFVLQLSNKGELVLWDMNNKKMKLSF
jgi:hypothetical protein